MAYYNPELSKPVYQNFDPATSYSLAATLLLMKKNEVDEDMSLSKERKLQIFTSLNERISKMSQGVQELLGEENE